MKTQKIIGTLMLLAGAGTVAYMYSKKSSMSYDQQKSAEKYLIPAFAVGVIGLFIIAPTSLGEIKI